MGTTAVKSSKITFLQPPPSSDGLIRPAAAAAAGAKAAAAGNSSSGKAAAAEVLGADNAGELVRQPQSKSSKKRSEPEPDAGEQQQQQQDDDDDAALLANGIDGMDTDEDAEQDELSAEPTLGQRVLELEKQQQQQGAAGQAAAAAGAAAAAAGAGDDSDPAAAAGAAVLPAGPLKADSLAVLLSQALRSSDRALLERCLSVGRERVIVSSVKRLVPMDAALLLKAAVERLQTKPSRGQQLAAWIQAVLLHHTAYLMSAPAAAPLMSSLYQIIEARLAMQRQLLSLSGRLELLLAQRGGPSDAAQGGGAAGATPAAQVGMRKLVWLEGGSGEVLYCSAFAGCGVSIRSQEQQGSAQHSRSCCHASASCSTPAHAALCCALQVVYQESDSEAEVEIVDAAGGGSSDDGEGDEFTTDDEGEDESADDMSGDGEDDASLSEGDGDADGDGMDEDSEGEEDE
jgi:hypothetical protein